MKLLRHGEKGNERPGMLAADGTIRDLAGVVADIAGTALQPGGLERLAALAPGTLPLVDPATRIGPCVGKVGKVIGIGLNYADHAAESGMPVPDEPILFGKAASSLSGPNDDVIIPRGSDRLDWEVELAIVIGAPGVYIDKDRALDHVAGYCICNDVSERSFQTQRSGQWIKGKSADTFGPLGPWLVTRDEIPDPQVLKMWLTVNGETMQVGSTRTMVFGVAHLVSYVSQFMSLQSGDVITTGTPPGVGMGKTPPRYLQAGDVMELGIEGLGRQRQTVVASAG